MKRITQQLLAAFAVSAIVIAALCGFIMVDLSTDRYMPADYAPLFQITSAGPEGVSFAAMGERYSIGPGGPLEPLREILLEYRGFLPWEITLTGVMTTYACAEAERRIAESGGGPEEPW